MSDQETVDVPAMIQQLSNRVIHLQKHALAYGGLMNGHTPIMSWPAQLGDSPVEIMTDLSLLPEPNREAILQNIAAVHADGINQALNQVEELTKTLKGVMQPGKQEAPAEPAGGS